MALRLLLGVTRKERYRVAFLHRCCVHASSSPFVGESERIPQREDMISRLKKNEEYDILIIGGGSTGAGTIVHNIFSMLQFNLQVLLWMLPVEA